MLCDCHRWSLLSWKGKQKLCLLFLSAGFPSTPLTEHLTEKKKQKHFVATTELTHPTAPDGISVISVWPTKAHSQPKKTADVDGRWIEMQHCQMNYRHFYHRRRLAIRKVLTDPWYKAEFNSSVKRQKGPDHHQWLNDCCTRSQRFRL